MELPRWLGVALGLATATALAELPLIPAMQGRPAMEGPQRLPENVATWNLQWFPGNQPGADAKSRRRHEREVATILQHLKVDLWMVQEVVDREALFRVAREFPWKVVSNFQRAGDEDPMLPVQNVAILSKAPIRESWEVGFQNLPLTPDRPVRGFLGARVGSKKRGLTVYAVHLKSNRGGREASARRRERAMEYLQKDWESRGLDPFRDLILVAGDFNCSLKNPEFAGEQTIHGLLREGWVSTTEGIPWPQGATTRPDVEGRYPASDFDHILLSPGWVKEVERGRWKAGVVHDQRMPSDHYPVVLRLEGKD